MFVYRKDKVNFSTSILWERILGTQKPVELKNTIERYIWTSHQKETVKISCRQIEKMLLTKWFVVSKPRKELLTVWIHCSIALCKCLIACLNAAVYNGPVLRLCLPDAVQASHKLELLKLK